MQPARRERILQSARRHGLGVEHDEAALRVRIDQSEGRTIVLRIPDDVFEWFVTLEDSAGEELWSDWGEEALDGTPEERIEDYEETVLSLIELFVQYELRLEGDELELYAQGRWLEWWKVEPPELPTFPITLHWKAQGASELFESEEELCEHLPSFHSIAAADEVDVRDVNSRHVWLRIEDGRLVVLQLATTDEPPLAMQHSQEPAGRGCGLLALGLLGAALLVLP